MAELDIVVRECRDTEREYWDRNVQRFAFVHPLNAYGWGIVRKVDGWIPTYLVAEKAGQFIGALLVLRKKVPLLPWCVLYAPKGPVCDPKDTRTVCALHRKVSELARTHNAVFLRIEPNSPEMEANSLSQSLKELGYLHLEQRWTYWNSPRDVYRIDLTAVQSADELLRSLDRDTRRCIRKASRDGVVIEPSIEEKHLEEFYTIFREFSLSKGFMARGYGYQKALWSSYLADGKGRLFLARYQGEVIGGLICILFGRQCVAMHMGTPYRYQRLQTYYAYVWESIRWAKEEGCASYSFRGVGPSPTQEAFKRKFNPTIVSLSGYYDFRFKPVIYRMFHWAEFTALPLAWPFGIKLRKGLTRVKAAFLRG